MVKEIFEKKDTEIVKFKEPGIETKINIDFIKRKSTAKTFLGELKGDLQKVRNDKNLEMAQYIEAKINSYKKFYPEIITNIPIKKFKGESGIQIIRFPNCFQTIEHRKKEIDNGKIEIVEEKHKISDSDLKPLLQVIESLKFNKKYKTRYIAQEYLKMAKIDKNSKERRFFDEKGFNFEIFAGSRDLYIPFNIMLKILNYFKFIYYHKSGYITRLGGKFEIQGIFFESELPLRKRSGNSHVLEVRNSSA